MDAFWIILTGSLVAITGSLLGSFLVLRRMAMVGDAIAHAVLPGIVIAFLLSGTRASLVMLIGATLTGVLTTFLIEFIHERFRLQTDASIGIVYTFFFATGIILISALAGQVDLDQDCVLYGEIAYVPLDLWVTHTGINLGPRNVWILGINFLFIASIVLWGFRGLYLTTFDPLYAKTIGLSTTFWHYLLMSLVSLTTVLAFESVGAILVLAFFIAPALSAYLVTHSFKAMLITGSIIGTLAAITGYYLAFTINGSIAGSMATMGGVLFIIAFAWSKAKPITQEKHQ